MKVEELCRCLLWCNTLRAGVCFLGKVEQTVKSPKKESHFKAQLPVAELLCNNALVYASFIKAVVLLASLPVTKVGNENPPLSKLFSDDRQVGFASYHELTCVF